MPRMVGRPKRQRDRALLVKGPVKEKTINESRGVGDDVSDDGQIQAPDALFLGGDGALQRRNAHDGSQVWEDASSSWQSMEVDPDNERIFVGASDGEQVASFSFSGSQIWSVDPHSGFGDVGSGHECITLSQDLSTVYNAYIDASDNVHILAIDASTGSVSKLGLFADPHGFWADRTIDNTDQWLYMAERGSAGGGRGVAYRISKADGSLDWYSEIEDSNSSISGPSILATDTVLWWYMADSLYAIDPSTGQKYSSYDFLGHTGSGPYKIWKDSGNSNSVYIASDPNQTTESYLHRAWILSSSILVDETLYTVAAGSPTAVCRDRVGNFYMGNDVDNDILVKLDSDLNEVWQVNASCHELVTSHGHSVRW